nr:sulfite exporter TauE/SafE family protein [Pedobacter panaciterrae]
MEHAVILLVTGLIAGALNAAAGGGSFITMPVLVYTGVPALEANASSTVALFPGSLASAVAFRKEIQPFANIPIRTMIFLTLAGGCTGALLLLFTPAKSFNILVPWLLLTGTLAFAFGKRAGEILRRKFQISSSLVLFSQFLLGIYGGYFGGAVGIMMMAVWSLFGLSDIKVVNANKTLLVGVANTIAVILFILAGKIWWPETICMMAGTISGGYFGARYTRKINPRLLRVGITVFNFIITALFFIRVYSQ